jgi:hypothetical protein
MTVLRRAALIAVLLGAAGSVGFLLRAGQRTSLLLLVIMVTWVLAPFAALVFAGAVSKRWAFLIRVTLYGVMLVVTLGSLAIYVNDAVRPRQTQAAFVFVVVPLASWLLMAIAIPIAVLVSRRLVLPSAFSSGSRPSKG